MALKLLNGLSDGRGGTVPKEFNSSGGLRDGWNNPFNSNRVGGGNSVRNSSGNSYRRSMSNIKSLGGGIQSLSNSMSRIGNTVMSQIGRLQNLADVNEQDYVDEASLGVNSAYDKMQGIQSRSLSRFGISPNSGKFQGQTQDLNLLRAAVEAGARNKARITARNDSFNRNMQVANATGAMAGQAAGIYSSAGNMLGNAGNMYSHHANSARQDAEAEAAWNAYNNEY